MNTAKNRHRQDVALFRYGLIAELVKLPPGSEQADAIRALAGCIHAIPGSMRTRIAPGTLRDWIRRYRQSGFDGLMPKTRCDRARPRRMAPEVIETLLAIKSGNPRLSVREVINQAREGGEIPAETPLPPSTVHRLFAREGLMVRHPQAPLKDMRRFAFRYAGELWQADTMHGPRVADGNGRRRKTHLLAILDDATRVIPYARFGFGDTIANFLSVLREAVTRRGLPFKLYVDNGSNFRSKDLAIICARLDIALVHAKPYHAAGKGKIERFFRTCRQQCLAPLEAQGIPDLETLNRHVRSWVESEYHLTGHRGLDGETPFDRWARTAERVRFADPGLDLEQMFLFETTRTVSKARTISLHTQLYQVDAGLQGKTVTLRYDPATPHTRPVWVFDKDHPAGIATPVDLYANTERRQGRPRLRFVPPETHLGDE